MYKAQTNKNYDFKGENYSTRFPNLHRYPATMLPQIGIELFKELKMRNKNRLLDPYCGTGSSFLAGMSVGFSEFHGFDINPLALLIAKAKYTKLNIKTLFYYKKKMESLDVFEKENTQPPSITNIDFWFSKKTIKDLSVIRHSILKKVKNKPYQYLFWIAFSETVRFVSYTRNSEFKLYRMTEEKRKWFCPNVFEIYFKNLNKILSIYLEVYRPLLAPTGGPHIAGYKLSTPFAKNHLGHLKTRTLKTQKFCFYNKRFVHNKIQYDAVLTSPPYGDSRTTVAYGQFSALSNEWIGFAHSRKIDSQLMGGKRIKNLYNKGVLLPFVKKINKINPKRALEISSFYKDLTKSIKEISQAIKKKGFSVYVVGNRTVKNITLPTDQFIAEQFEKNSFKHILTYKRAISSKVIPSQNSPTNIIGKKAQTMNEEYIIVCQKI